ncbi:ATP-binding cassette subfamily B protein RaxB [Microvirga flocculans]|uniref:ATP-binding cassette subfamily B protein RaxB n=1 Tax=Microvirga flocculans TaxID=217168 RepID=A0A7W6IEX9_9HYPH|nr:peptidase domain-containing ABC transporter [Microvirga flocculans]MBB4039614.1 ATP-binding cassette subfamily B protein RaxB [Microvirga flocculans]
MTFSAHLDFFGGPRLPAIIQSEAAECGLACLAMIATYHGREVDLIAMRRLFSVSLKGVTLRDVLIMGQRLGMTGRGLRLEPEQLKEIKLPCILHWDMNHFVVLKEVGARKVTIHDPAMGARTLTFEEVGRHFTGIALELTPTESFERRKETSRLSLTALWGRMRGIKRALAQALALSAVLQIVVLTAPFYMQLAVDEAVMKGDQDLLTALALGFGLLVLIQIGAEWLRSHVLLFLGSALNFQMGANLFHHLVRLPLAWFEKRHIGDLVSRFRSAEPIERLVSEGLVAALVDGVMATLTLAMILIYSPALSGIVLVALALYALLRFALYRALRQRQEEMIEAEAKEQTTFIETARAIQSIKIFGREADREALWQNRYAESISRGIRQGRFTIGFKTANDLIYGLENVLIVYLGARAIMANDMTIGMLYAFMAYKEQFLSKATNLIETGIRYRMLDLHLDRLSDIALAEREQDRHGESLVARQMNGAVELRDVSFRYADTEPEVLSGVNLRVEAGEFVAITGPSGGGKTTLLKIMLGLFRPMTGSVLIDGVPLDHFGIRAFRAEIGVVMQDDQLLSGSIAENICFFDASLDLDWMRACAAVAGIDEEIMAMPMNYNTLIGDMGTTLSGGQRQRVLLARALYRRPRILFMDEGTSSLDLDKEREVNRALAELKITRIVIAHRPETIRAADRIVVLREGRVSPPLDPESLAFADAARPGPGTAGIGRS